MYDTRSLGNECKRSICASADTKTVANKQKEVQKISFAVQRKYMLKYSGPTADYETFSWKRLKIFVFPPMLYPPCFLTLRIVARGNKTSFPGNEKSFPQIQETKMFLQIQKHCVP